MLQEYEPMESSTWYLSSSLGIAHNIKTLQTNGPAVIDGVLNDDGLTVSLGSLDSRSATLKRSCVRFIGADLQTIADIPGHAHGFCDVLAGETGEGLRLVIESHRCYTSDLQGNASALKVRTGALYLGFY